VKIYTRTGDTGETSLFDGTRVPKNDARVEAYGEVDELNAWLGFARSSLSDQELDAELAGVQRDLFAIGAQLADPAHKIAARVTKAAIVDADIERLERLIDRFEQELSPIRRFVLAGGTTSAAALHLARAVCRRVERHIVALNTPDKSLPLRYINRLSDFLFVAARLVNKRAGVAEHEW